MPFVQVHAAEKDEHPALAGQHRPDGGDARATAGAGNPPSSVSGTSAVAVPSASAAGAQPEPSTTAMSCRD